MLNQEECNLMIMPEPSYVKRIRKKMQIMYPTPLPPTIHSDEIPNGWYPMFVNNASFRIDKL